MHAIEILLSFVQQQQQVKFIYLSLHEVAITIKRPYRVKFHPEQLYLLGLFEVNIYSYCQLVVA